MRHGQKKFRRGKGLISRNVAINVAKTCVIIIKSQRNPVPARHCDFLNETPRNVGGGISPDPMLL